MPTARPIIRARVGVVVEMVATDATVKMVDMVMPTPSAAVISGSPAAISEPKVTDKTMKATKTPIRSVRPTPAPVEVYMSPPSVVV